VFGDCFCFVYELPKHTKQLKTQHDARPWGVVGGGGGGEGGWWGGVEEGGGGGGGGFACKNK